MQLTINLEGRKTKAAEEITVVVPSEEFSFPAIPKTRAKSDSFAEIACATFCVGVFVIVAVKPVNTIAKGYFHPAVKELSSGAAPSGDVPKPASSGGFIFPVANHCVTSEFDLARLHPIAKVVRPHTGIDLGDAQGTPVVSVKDGTVTSAGSNGGYGNQIVVDHGNGLSTSYSHLSVIKAGKDQQVKQGDVIGLMGSTGSSTAPHLHFEVKEGGAARNPRNYIQFKKLREGC